MNQDWEDHNVYPGSWVICVGGTIAYLLNSEKEPRVHYVKSGMTALVIAVKTIHHNERGQVGPSMWYELKYILLIDGGGLYLTRPNKWKLLDDGQIKLSLRAGLF